MLKQSDCEVFIVYGDKTCAVTKESLLIGFAFQSNSAILICVVSCFPPPSEFRFWNAKPKVKTPNWVNSIQRYQSSRFLAATCCLSNYEIGDRMSGRQSPRLRTTGRRHSNASPPRTFMIYINRGRSISRLAIIKLNRHKHRDLFTSSRNKTFLAKVSASQCLCE